MGVEARYQAIPEDCALLALARRDVATAEMMVHFNSAATKPSALVRLHHPEFIVKVQQTLEHYPGLAERYFYAGSRHFDHIVYLLSAARRDGNATNDDSLIHQAVYGTERLHPEANATQGHPIGFAPAGAVQTLADYLSGVSQDMLREHFDLSQMGQQHVYKAAPDMPETAFEQTWREFEGMQRVYGQAAAHGEAMITVID